MFQRHAIQKLHCNESLAILLPDIVDCADVGVIQCGCRLCLALETSQGLRVSGNIFWQEFECDKAMQPSVLGLVNHTHAPAAQLFDDAVVRDGLTNHRSGVLSLSDEHGRPTRTASQTKKSAVPTWDRSHSLNPSYATFRWRTFRLTLPQRTNAYQQFKENPRQARRSPGC